MKNTFIGVDFSLHSPGVCIKQHRKNTWLAFESPTKKYSKKELKILEDLKSISDVEVTTLKNKPITNNYLRRDFEALRLYTDNALTIIKKLGWVLGKNSEDISYNFIFEGFSYSSNTNNLIDIVSATTILKNMVILEFIYSKDTMMTLAPSTVKKHAGNGRLNKRQLWDVFINNELNDPELDKSDFYHYCKDYGLTTKSVPSPLDDLIDAYFVIKAGEATLLNDKQIKN